MEVRASVVGDQDKEEQKDGGDSHEADGELVGKPGAEGFTRPPTFRC